MTDFRALAAGIAFSFMWSSAFTSARIIVAHAPPLTALSIRFIVSGLIALALARAMGESWRLTPGQWRATIIFGICQNALYLGLNFVAVQTVEASLATIIASALPLLVGVSLWIGAGERLPPLGVLGLVAGFSGVAIILGTRISGDADVFGIMLCGIGVAALTIATLALRGASSGGNVLTVVGLQMLIGAGILGVIAVPTEPWEVSWSIELGLAFLYTTLVPGLTATWVWFWLVRRIGATRAATFHFLNPVFGVATAAVLLGERMGALDLVGVAVVTGGILAVQMSRQSQN